LTNKNDWEGVRSLVPEIPEADRLRNLVKCDTNTAYLGKLIRATLAVRSSTRFAVDADKRVRFKFIEDAMSTLRKNKAFTFNFVTDKRKGNK
jgi:biopolymer transport protein ExbD